jgi:hypothetical protein
MKVFDMDKPKPLPFYDFVANFEESWAFIFLLHCLNLCYIFVTNKKLRSTTSKSNKYGRFLLNTSFDRISG